MAYMTGVFTRQAALLGQDGFFSLKGIFMKDSRWIAKFFDLFRVAALAFPMSLMVIPSPAARAGEAVTAKVEPSKAEEEGFIKLDQDKDGELNQDEFVVAKDKIREELKSHFIGLARFDRLGSGAMPKLFARLDSDGNGKLNKGEFSNLRETLVELLKSRSR